MLLSFFPSQNRSPYDEITHSSLFTALAPTPSPYYSIPNCRLLESGWDKGNWFVRLVKVEDARLAGAGVGEAAPVPPPTRLAVKGGH